MSTIRMNGAAKWYRATALAVGFMLTNAADGWAQSAGDAPLLNPLAAQPLAGLSATTERPLFSPTRHPRAPDPMPVASIAPPPPPPPPPTVALFGIVRDDEGAQAVLRTGNNQMMRVRVGDAVSGWKVTAIEPRRLVLMLDDRSASFSLFSGHGGKSPPNVVAVARGGSQRLNRQGRGQPLEDPSDADDLPSR